MGVIGWFFGGGVDKAGNIRAFTMIVAFAAIILCLATMAILGFTLDWKTQGDLGFKVLVGIFSIITLAAGYVFGAAKGWTHWSLDHLAEVPVELLPLGDWYPGSFGGLLRYRRLLWACHEYASSATTKRTLVSTYGLTG